MAETRITNIVVPDVFNPYMRELTVDKINFYLGGIVKPDPAFDVLASKGGKLINMPFWDDLSGDDEVLSDSGSLTVNPITADTDIAVLLMRGKAFGENDLATALSGDDPMAHIADRFANYKIQKIQDSLINSLAGVFADNVANDSGDMVNDISTEDYDGSGDSANEISSDAIIDTITGTIGDKWEDLTGMAIHSAVFSFLQKQNVIDYETPENANVKIPYYQGKRVLVSDKMPSEAGTTAGTKYTSYFFGDGAFAYGEGNPPVPTETDRDSLAGYDVLIHRWHILLHPRGVKFASGSVAGASPTNAELALAANWDRVYLRKNVKLAALVCNA